VASSVHAQGKPSMLFIGYKENVNCLLFVEYWETNNANANKIWNERGKIMQEWGLIS
jgi:hypothetical protein